MPMLDPYVHTINRLSIIPIIFLTIFIRYFTEIRLISLDYIDQIKFQYECENPISRTIYCLKVQLLWFFFYFFIYSCFFHMLWYIGEVNCSLRNRILFLALYCIRRTAGYLVETVKTSCSPVPHSIFKNSMAFFIVVPLHHDSIII